MIRFRIAAVFYSPALSQDAVHVLQRVLNFHKRTSLNHLIDQLASSTSSYIDSNLHSFDDCFESDRRMFQFHSLLTFFHFRLRSMKDHFPSTYSEAECLCSGCILIQNQPGRGRVPVENFSYNSVPIMQSRVFLKRELCSDSSNKYRLTPVSQDVAVGCTCVRPTSA